jgi:hypothetical protein
MIRLNQRAAADPKQFHKLYVGIPWDFEMPPKLPPDWQERGLEWRWPLPKGDKPAES